MKPGKPNVAVSSYHPAVTLTEFQAKARTRGSIGSELICWVVTSRRCMALGLGILNVPVAVVDGETD
jgi:hypothetical protein